jgi:hypothetical protein
MAAIVLLVTSHKLFWLRLCGHQLAHLAIIIVVYVMDGFDGGTWSERGRLGALTSTESW